MRGLRKLASGAAPLLVLAGVALLPRGERSAAGARAPEAREPQRREQPADDGRGRAAQSPRQIPAKGWRDILLRAKKEFGEDNIAMISAGVTFYALLALFPGLAALISVYGLFSDPGGVQRHIAALSGVLPSGALQVIGDQMTSLAQAPATGLTASFALGLLLSVWSANGALKALMVGLNVAYGEHERRGLVKRTLTSLGLTAGLLAFAILALAAAGFGAWLKDNVGGPAATLANAAIWVVLLAVLSAGLAVVYRYGPSREPVRLQWISWGSALTILAWLVMSAAFTAYVANFGRYNKVYGSLGAVVGFMTWIYLSSMVVLAGAELNAEVEHQTAVDTTEGPPKPLGSRDAKMADTVGRSP